MCVRQGQRRKTLGPGAVYHRLTDFPFQNTINADGEGTNHGGKTAEGTAWAAMAHKRTVDSMLNESNNQQKK
jgi:hypothetical protein